VTTAWKPAVVAACMLLAGMGTLSAQAQALGASTGGTVALRQAERMLGHTKRVLMVAAHPDDEDTELLTVLVRGHGAEAAYLSLSRGEGGQNLIGPELGEALGLIRTEELLSARELDGARQYFTRAFDFGFSKNIDEASRFWPRDSVLKDAVRVVRRFRPQIMIAIFSGTPRDGHGQHQMAGWAALEAFAAAGDPARFPELQREEGLAPWAPVKLYRSARFDPTGASISLEGGILDGDIGQSYRQVAMRGRSLHRSQDMGVLQEPGPSTIRLALIEDRTGAGASDFWAGVDTAPPGPGSDGIAARDQARHAADAAVIRAGLVVDATATDGRIVPGQRLPVRLTVWNAGARPASAEFALSAPSGWGVTLCSPARVSVAPGTVSTCTVEVAVAADAPLTTPYFLIAPRDGAMYRWVGNPASWGEPFEPPPLVGRVTLTPEGLGPVLQERPVAHRYRDQAIGEVRAPIMVVPRVDVKLAPAEKVWPIGTRSPQVYAVTLQHGVAEPTRGTVTLELPQGWPPVPPQPFSLTRSEERESLVFQVRAPPGLATGNYEVRAVARDSAGRRFAAGQSVVEYSHIRPRTWVTEALSAVHAAPITLPRLTRVGYIRGASDRVPEALIDIGLPVELIDAATLERGDLARYDVIVVGSRAYEVDPALVENNGRLLEYARAGGRVLVQYQQQQFFNGRFAPAPLTVGQPHDRVTDESAPVTLLDPNSAAISRPNRLDAADWSGWVQERGLYFARTWDPTYQPLLALSDSGSAPLRGGLLVAQVGRGTYTYTGLSFFRQLPAGIPGAYRLFLNLLDLRATPPQP
jgi:LmbE family N-acetylglucosaminyl deacetylase